MNVTKYLIQNTDITFKSLNSYQLEMVNFGNGYKYYGSDKELNRAS